MTLTREQVADLQPGDVVRIVEVSEDGSRYIHEGPVRADGGNALEFAGLWLRSDRGDAPNWAHSLTVVSRAPRPLYVNHPRTKPVAGDIARDRDGDAWLHQAGVWLMSGGNGRIEDNSEYAPLTLLWDGETGQAVQ